ncbi:hypothetical protein H0H81_011375 [Sphagnurus paluster]|uniref:Uncharacterized protein n=1 Tax=Sphagnurus paluster TaxID=117069 RepID=A0A9P7FV57_9AGAR|nr:hypothetical protein H0H81_011375 [Sphagnurus paluster]
MARSCNPRCTVLCHPSTCRKGPAHGGVHPNTPGLHPERLVLVVLGKTSSLMQGVLPAVRSSSREGERGVILRTGTRAPAMLRQCRPAIHARNMDIQILVNVFSNILEVELRKRYKRGLGLKTLSSLARTCRAFTGPALDELWRVQLSLVHLIKCLPRDAYELGKKNIITISRQLVHHDYDRLRFYAPRIRTIVVAPSHVGDLDPLVAPMLWTGRAIYGGTLLPNLRDLSIDISYFEGQAVLPRLLITPKLRKIALRGPEWNGDEAPLPWTNLTAVIKPMASSLTRFSLDTDPPSEGLHIPRYRTTDTFMDLHQSFYHLVDLDTHGVNITHTVLSYLASMKKLRKLNFGISVDELTQFLETNSHEGDFPCLGELKIDIEKLSIVERLLERSGFKRLQTLTVLQSDLDDDLEDLESEWDLEAFFQALNSSQESHSELRSLSILNYPSINGPSEHVLPFTSTALGFILPFSSLFFLKITFRVSIVWTDADLEAIPNAWPMLQTLSLEDEQEGIPSTTLKGLIQLLYGCRELEQLMIRVDARHPPIFAESGDLGVIAPKLQYLDMVTSPLDNPEQFAALIMMAFPALTDLYCTGYDDANNIHAQFPSHHPHQTYAKAWNTVTSQLAAVLESRWVLIRED